MRMVVLRVGSYTVGIGTGGTNGTGDTNGTSGTGGTNGTNIHGDTKNLVR